MVADETKAKIKSAWTESGETAALIAARLGLTRSQVIGICHRAGWQRNSSILSGQQRQPIGHDRGEVVETMEDRFRRYEQKLAGVLAKNVGVGRITVAEQPKREPARRHPNFRLAHTG